MSDTRDRAAAIVGLGAILPDAPDVTAFWRNVRQGRYSISEVPKGRWDPALYYDADPKAPDKTYSKIGGWVGDWEWDPLGWHLPIPPRVSDAMDDAQKWAIACTREALADYGYPGRELDPERTAVILGNAMAGERHYMTALRIFFPEFAEDLRETASFRALPKDVQGAILEETRATMARHLPEITEDTMPGELGNILAGRVANVMNFRGPNFIVDAACASGMASMSAAFDGLLGGDFDAVITGGVDRNMAAPAFVKFSKIGALSATGTRPYAEGADGFVMGEGAAVFLMKRLADAERDGDRIYAVVLSLAGSSDGKGKGITAPNPIGQRLAVERAWSKSGLSPLSVSMIEGHGTSTRVGDVVEVEAIQEAFAPFGLEARSVPLGSVKSNIGHLKAAAGAAGLLKAVLCLHEKVLPPSINFDRPNPNIDFEHSPFRVNTELREWETPEGGVRVAGVSAFGFGGTNFHAVLEEHAPGRHGDGKKVFSVPEVRPAAVPPKPAEPKAPLRGALVIGAGSTEELAERLRHARAQSTPSAPLEADLRAPERIAIDYVDAADLASKVEAAERALAVDNPGMWKALRARGIFRGTGPAPKVAFLYTGQGSQYVNMLRDLAEAEPIVAQTFAEADLVMTPLLGRPLSDYIFVEGGDVAKAESDLMRTEITQPAVLAADLALTRLLGAYGIEPDMAMGHSLGEYGALLVAGSLSFAHALEAVSARGHEVASLSIEDNGKMAAIFAPLPEIERIVNEARGYVVIANVNSTSQAVIAGASAAMDQTIAAFTEAGYPPIPLPVSHAFHTKIVAPASEPLRRALIRLDLRAPTLPIVANVSGEFYPVGEGALEQMLDILARHVASPVQFVKGLHSLFDAGARAFVEVGPKKALQGFVDDVLGEEPGVTSLFTNHPKVGGVASFNQALCGLYAAGLGIGLPAPIEVQPTAEPIKDELGDLFDGFLERARQIFDQGAPRAPEPDPKKGSVVITGAALGLPGTERIFDEGNVGRILRGEQLIGAIPAHLRQAMLDKHVTRLVKPEDGDPTFETIDSLADVIKLAGRGGAFDLEAEFGISPERRQALDRATCLAVAAGIDALRDAGIPLVRHYRTTSKGTKLPERWELPEELQDETGVIFASAFPGYDAFADELTRYQRDRGRREQVEALEDARASLAQYDGTATPAKGELDRRIHELQAILEREPYVFDRRFLFKSLPMGHAQFAEIVGARGPNTQMNAACASTTQAIAMAQDWIGAGRCRRVIVIAADDATSDNLLEWIGAGFLASGAAATDEVVEDAATPFDRRRHGMIIGMGAAAMVIESAEAAAERSIRPICQVLSSVTANSAFHGSRLDVSHIARIMETLVSTAEERWGIDRHRIAPETVFMSHETYTPARGGSAAAEVVALRQVFGKSTDSIVVANTKGFTGHPMGVGIEDIVAVKSLETGVVPPVPNFKEVDPDLGSLNLSKGGPYPVRYALRLAAGFGSQISMTLLRWIPSEDGSHRAPDQLGYEYRVQDEGAWRSWLARVTGVESPELEVVQHRLRVKDGEAIETVPIQVSVPTVALPEPPAPEPETIAPEPAIPVIAQSAREAVLALVAEKTGYPQDMLDLDLDLEADLGVDTVKQAEIFATVRESYGIPREENLKLRDFPTLAHVIRFVEERTPGLQPLLWQPATAPEVTQPAEIPPSDNRISVASAREAVLALVAEKTGYPKDMLDLDLDLEADLGVDTVKQAEIFATVRESYGIPREENLKLRDFPTLAHVIQFVEERAGLPAAVEVEAVEEPPAPAEPAAVSMEEAREAVLALVAEKTGYPKDMLDLDLDLEADLGVDTVKQAEIFATVRESYGIPREENLKLRDFPTLAHVIRFVEERAGAPVPVVLEAQVAAARSAPASLEAADAVPRRVPVPVLRPPLEMCKPTGVVLGPGSRVVVGTDIHGVGDELVRRLDALGVETLRIDTALGVDEFSARLEGWAAAGPVQGIFWLPALDVEEAIEDMDLSAWQEGLRRRVKLLAIGARTLYGAFAEPGAFLVAATRLGGRHGYDDAGAVAPMGGAVTGFVKALKRERDGALVKAVDFASDAAPARMVDALLEETLKDPGAVEVGHRNGLRWSIGVQLGSALDGHPGFPLDDRSVFVVTGAAGSIVSAIVSDLAAASGGTFHLLDLAPEPQASDPDLVRFVGDRDGLKRELFDRIVARGERATPVMVERQLAALERGRAALDAMQAVRAAGGEAHYHQVDLRDATAVGSAINEVRSLHGRIDVLLHAAGVEISHLLPDKEQREFDLVFDVKAEGWFNLLHAIGDMPLGATVAFSSVAGRFGNGGQTDYSAANDLLCKATSSLRTTRPETRGIVIDWTAWAGIGMASRGSIPKMMELAGIDMLPAEAGIPVIRRELTVGATRGEVIIGERLGVLLDEWDGSGGLTPTSRSGDWPMIGEVTGMGVNSGLTVRTSLDPAAQPFLDDHRMDGTALLPGVMGIEAFAELALLPLPDWHVASVEDVEFLAPFKFYRDAPRSVELRAVFRPDGEEIVAKCSLSGIRELPGQAAPVSTMHFTATVRLSRTPPVHARTISAGTVGEGVGAQDIYRMYFHGPAFQVLDRAFPEDARAVGLMASALPPDRAPSSSRTLMAPRMIELCFQTAGVWDLAARGRFALPMRVDRVSVVGDPAGAEGRLSAVVVPDGDAFDAVVSDEAGNVFVRLEGYGTVELPGSVEPALLGAFEAALA